jgi:hypothetical protein
MREHGSLPRAREDGLLEETVGEELLLYDRDSHTAHCLNPIAASVWRHCDGAHDVTELAGLAGVSEDLVTGALHELREKDLLAAEPTLTQSTIPGESRREAIGRVARYSAAAAAGSMIVSATAATPAMASSGEEEEEVIVKRGENYKCKGPVGVVNCCLCKEACIEGKNANTPSKPTCESLCKTKYGGYEGWATDAKCE